MMSAARTAANPSAQRRAVGTVRVYRTNCRKGERFVSPEEQRERIDATVSATVCSGSEHHRNDATGPRARALAAGRLQLALHERA